MAHYIVDTCIGCTACVTVCPTDAISGEKKVIHEIDPVLCIDCDACVRVCPVEAIADQNDNFKPRIPKRSDWPKPVVYPELCTGCSFCVDICPFDCLTLGEAGPMFGISQLVKPNACVGCKECEEVCAKGAIVVLPVEEREAQRNRVGGGGEPPSSHTTGHAGPHPAVHQALRMVR